MLSVSDPPPVQHLGPLLAHLPHYGVVVCRPCKFAVQPNALSSHLLRHRVYREKRQKLLACLAKLTLLEPDEVTTPSSRVPAVPDLSVATGYRCSLPGCNHLCVSRKRMSQHLRERHGSSPSTDVDRNAQRVYVQTFFKGTKVRYFEVDSGNVPAADEPADCANSTYRFLNWSQTMLGDGGSPASVLDNGSGKAEGASITQSQMQDLLYLHHYTISTGLSMTRGIESSNFWTHDVPLQASSQPILMHGILGVAAFHQAWLASDPEERKAHRMAGLRHQSAGLNIFRSMIDSPTTQTRTALPAFARFLGVQWCAEALLEAQGQSSHSCGSTDSRVSKIQEFMLLIRGGLDLLLGTQGLLPSVSPLIVSAAALPVLWDLETLPDVLIGTTPYLVNEVCKRLAILTDSSASSTNHLQWPYRTKNLDDVRYLVRLCLQASNVTDTQQITIEWARDNVPSTSHLIADAHLLIKALQTSLNPAKELYQMGHSSGQPAPPPILLCYPHIPLPIYSQLMSLPARLSAVITKQQDFLDVQAFNQAMAALVSSFSRSFETDSAWARWNGIESWPRMLSDHFFGMIDAIDPWALILVAFWCCILSKQEEAYWFWQGQSQRMLNIVFANLNTNLQCLVRESISAMN